MVDLGTLGGSNSYALGINNGGEVVGYSYLADNVTKHSFTWTDATGLVDIGTLPGGGSIEAIAVNEAGNATGDAIDANGIQVPYFWSPIGGFVALAESHGDSRNYGFGINDNDHITGQRYTGEVVHAFDWIPGGAHRGLPPLPGGLHSVGTAINNRDNVTGTASDARGIFVATLWARGATAGRAIGGLGSTDYSSGRAINEKNEVAGFSGGSVSTGFYWSRSTGTIILQTLGGATAGGFAINESSAIGGYSANSSGLTHAVIWADKNSAPQDLGTLAGGANSYAIGLNDAGQACGYADVP